MIFARASSVMLEHDAEKCERFSDDIMLYFFDLYPAKSFSGMPPARQDFLSTGGGMTGAGSG
ncbi:hypothetical protein ACC771_09430, partial [Rhizobium ruizarguesonis]